jgi:hypothetical protein
MLFKKDHLDLEFGLLYFFDWNLNIIYPSPAKHIFRRMSTGIVRIDRDKCAYIQYDIFSQNPSRKIVCFPVLPLPVPFCVKNRQYHDSVIMSK